MSYHVAVRQALAAVRREHGDAGLDAVATFLRAMPDTTGLVQHVGSRREVWGGVREVERWVREAREEGATAGNLPGRAPEGVSAATPTAAGSAEEPLSAILACIGHATVRPR